MAQVTARDAGIGAVAGEVRSVLATSDTHAALRIVADFVARFCHEGLADRRAMLSPRPQSTGSDRWDALLAGVVEMLANSVRLTPPTWTMEPSRFLTQWWFVTPFRSLHASAFVDTPAELANRGVFIHRSSLESV